MVIRRQHRPSRHTLAGSHYEVAQSDLVVFDVARGAIEGNSVFFYYLGGDERHKEPVVVRVSRTVTAAGVERMCVINKVARRRRDHTSTRQLTPVRVRPGDQESTDLHSGVYRYRDTERNPRAERVITMCVLCLCVRGY